LNDVLTNPKNVASRTSHQEPNNIATSPVSTSPILFNLGGLPDEIKLKIWSQAIADVGARVFVTHGTELNGNDEEGATTTHESRERGTYRESKSFKLLFDSKKVPAALHVCVMSRELAMGTFNFVPATDVLGQGFWVDPERDTIYFPDTTAVSRFLLGRTSAGPLSRGWFLTNMRHLAFGPYDPTSHLRGFSQAFTHTETVTTSLIPRPISFGDALFSSNAGEIAAKKRKTQTLDKFKRYFEAKGLTPPELLLVQSVEAEMRKRLEQEI
jgi:hypothetical protein